MGLNHKVYLILTLWCYHTVQVSGPQMTAYKPDRAHERPICGLNQSSKNVMFLLSPLNKYIYRWFVHAYSFFNSWFSICHNENHFILFFVLFSLLFWIKGMFCFDHDSVVACCWNKLMDLLIGCRMLGHHTPPSLSPTGLIVDLLWICIWVTLVQVSLYVRCRVTRTEADLGNNHFHTQYVKASSQVLDGGDNIWQWHYPPQHCLKSDYVITHWLWEKDEKNVREGGTEG